MTAEQELAKIIQQAKEDIACFAVWPLGYEHVPHQERWLDLSQRYKKDPAYRRLLVVCPTDHGKTSVFSQILPLYEIYQNPDIRICLISNTASQAEAMLRTIVQQIEGNLELIRCFGNLKPKMPIKWTTTEIIVQRSVAGMKLKDPTVYACGIGAGIKSRHFDLIIADDLADRENSGTEEARKALSNWFWEDLMTRLDPGGRVIVVGTPEHYDDIYVEIASRGFVQIKEDAIIDEEKKIVLWPERWPWERLMAKKEEIGTLAFEKRYRCQVYPETLKSFPEAWVRKCNDSELGLYPGRNFLPEKMKGENFKVFIGIDLAVGKSAGSAYFAALVLGVDLKTQERYILHIHREKGMRMTQQKELVKTLWNEWQPDEIAVETNAYQDVFRQEIREMQIPVTGLYTSSRKNDMELGIPALSSLVEFQKLHIPDNESLSERQAELMEAFRQELISYPAGKTSDMLMAWYFAEQIAKKWQYKPRKSVIRNFARGSRRWQQLATLPRVQNF